VALGGLLVGALFVSGLLVGRLFVGAAALSVAGARLSKAPGAVYLLELVGFQITHDKQSFLAGNAAMSAAFFALPQNRSIANGRANLT
jgi:hypothetical protein